MVHFRIMQEFLNPFLPDFLYDISSSISGFPGNVFNQGADIKQIVLFFICHK
jgi:hypothetical protein